MTVIKCLTIGVAIIGLSASLAANCHARCVFPTPDGGNKAPSAANVNGYIAAIDNQIVAIRADHLRQNVSVRLSANTDFFTAFGGDFKANELKIGQKAWVWFVECKRPMAGIPVAAVFQVYSTDPKDRP